MVTTYSEKIIVLLADQFVQTETLKQNCIVSSTQALQMGKCLTKRSSQTFSVEHFSDRSTFERQSDESDERGANLDDSVDGRYRFQSAQEENVTHQSIPERETRTEEFDDRQTSRFNLRGDYHYSSDYEILDVIGKGGFGIVQKVQHLATGEVAAMKTLPLPESSSAGAAHKREVKNIVYLRKDINIVRVLAMFKEQSNELKIVMELCDCDLVAFMNDRHNHNLDNFLNLATQTSRGVMVLHTHKPPIVHRDLKPQNVLIVKSNNEIIAKLADFGLSSQADVWTELEDLTDEIPKDSKRARIGLKTPHSHHGTRPYLAPEFFAAEEEGIGLKDGQYWFDASVDVFALGQVFNYMFSYNKNDYGQFLNLGIDTVDLSEHVVHVATKLLDRKL